MDKDKQVHPKRLTKADIEKLRKSLPKRQDIGEAKPVEVVVEDDNVAIEPYMEEAAPEICVPMSAESINAFKTYAKMLREKNKVMNLTAIVDDQGIALRHFIDSLTLVSFIEAEQKKQGKKDLTVIDVGTGAGFPGIPLKISMRELRLTLMDSLAKRIGFLKEVTDALELTNVEHVHSRAEDAGKSKKYREKYDIATARAVANLPTLCEYCMPFVKVGGIFLAMKGRLDEDLENAGKAVATFGGTIERVERFTLPGTDMERTVVVIRKLRNTPAKYPRQAGKPSKEPIV